MLDVTEKDKMLKFIDEIDAKSPLDLVVANAGISGFVESPNEAYTVLQSVIDVTNTNVLGVANAIFPAFTKMCQRKRGQVAVMGSLSGYFPLMASPEYGAGKAYLDSMTRALRKYLALHHVGLTLLTPGFVRTPMLSSPKKYPFEVSLGEALPTIVDGIARDVGVVSFPTVPTLMTQMLGSIHPIFYDFIGPVLFTRVHKKVLHRLLLTEAEAASKTK